MAAEGRRRLRAAVGDSASTILGTLTRAREAPGANSRSRFHFLGSAARTAPALPRLAALAAAGAGGGAQSRPS